MPSIQMNWPKSRLLLAGIMASVLIIAGVVATVVHTANAAFVTVVDQQGVNDVNPAQNDLTQMGLDVSDAPVTSKCSGVGTRPACGAARAKPATPVPFSTTTATSISPYVAKSTTPA